MKKIRYFIILVIFFSLNSCDRLPFGSQPDENSFVGEWELIELTGGIGGNKWNFESPSPNTLKVLKLDDGLSFTYTRKTDDNFSRIETMKYVFVEEISMFDGEKRIMLGEKSSIDGKVYLTILYEFRENGNYLVLDDNAADGFRSVYKRIR